MPYPRTAARPRLIAIYSAVLVAGAIAVSAGSADAAPVAAARLAAYTQSGTTVDGTTDASSASTQIRMTMHVINPAAAGAVAEDARAFSDITFTRTPGSYSEGPPAVPDFSSSWYLSSGTPADGIWEFNVGGYSSGIAGTYSIGGLTLSWGAVGPDGRDVTQKISAATFAAAGAKPIGVRVTAPPAKPTNVTSSTGIATGSFEYGTGIRFEGFFRWTNTGPVATNSIVDSISGCGPKVSALAPSILYVPTPAFGFCTVKFHVFNSAGRSPQVSTTGFML